MLNPDDRLVFWQVFHERVSDLCRDVDDVLYSKFAPYRFEGGKLVEADKDTPDMKKLFDALEKLDEALKRKVESSSEECQAWYDEQLNKQRAFEAWSQGLCPKVMRDIPNMANFGEADTYEQIANLKHSKGISMEDTRRAVAQYDAAHKLRRF